MRTAFFCIWVRSLPSAHLYTAYLMHFCVQPEPSHASAQPTSCIYARRLPPLTFARNLLPAFLRAGCPALGARSLPPCFRRAACPRSFARSLPPAFLRAVSPSPVCAQPASCIPARNLSPAFLRAACTAHVCAQPTSCISDRKS